MITLKTPDEIEIMAEGGKRLARILGILKEEVRPGVTTLSLDALSHSLITEGGDRPAFLGYRPNGAGKAFPATLCTSVNATVVHGLPSRYVIQEGDIVKLDLGLIHHGLYVDAALSVGVGVVSRDALRLMQTTERALASGIISARAGNTLGDIGAAIEGVVQKEKFSVADVLTGHGIGRALHEDPYVLNRGRRGEGEVLKIGMVLAIEPMVIMGSSRVLCLPDDSYVAADGSLAAHYEHTVAITKDGPRVLTAFPHSPSATASP